MGRRGPPPMPTNIRLLRGNPGKRPFNRNEPRPQLGRPPCPRWLTREAKKEWRRVVPELERLGLLTIVDRATLAIYCQAWARYVEAEEKLKRYGSVLKAKDSDYIQVSPYQTISRQERHTAYRLAAEFGFTPSSRTRINQPSPKMADEFEDFLSEDSR